MDWTQVLTVAAYILLGALAGAACYVVGFLIYLELRFGAEVRRRQARHNARVLRRLEAKPHRRGPWGYDYSPWRVGPD